MHLVAFTSSQENFAGSIPVDGSDFYMMKNDGFGAFSDVRSSRLAETHWSRGKHWYEELINLNVAT